MLFSDLTFSSLYRQGNSGTILSHFFVELAEAVREVNKSDMSVDEFTSCLIKAGIAMDDSVPNPARYLALGLQGCIGRIRETETLCNTRCAIESNAQELSN